MFNYVPLLKFDEIKKQKNKNESKKIKERVIKAREIQNNRFNNTKYKFNSDIKGRDIFELCKLTKDARFILEDYFRVNAPSLRAYGKVIKVAQTIADLDKNKEIKSEHIIEAISYRRDINGEII